MAGWPTRLQSADRDYLPARHGVVGRTRDIARNDPIAASGVSRKTNAAVGRGWRFSSKPNARALGISPEAARELGQIINTEWSIYANSFDFLVDAERQGGWGQLLRMAANHLSKDGEGLAQVDYADDDPSARYKTCLRMIDPDRLSNPMGQPNSDTLRDGVEKNGRNVAIAYHIRERHAADIGISDKGLKWTRHPRYSTTLGRPNILHFFDRERAGQSRGISKFASTLKAFRGFNRFTDATIQAATVNALMLGFIKSNAGPSALSESFSFDQYTQYDGDREQFYGKNPITLGESILPVLAPGDEVNLQTASKDVTSFEAFTRSIIRLIAAALGVTYEEISMDYSQTNYSSARAAMVHAWAEIVSFMSIIETQLVKPFFVAWLEEAFDSGYITAPAGAPDFYEAIDAYADGRWLGPGRGYIDPTKEILAAAARIEAGISTLEKECAEQGEDYEEVLDQLAHESRMRADRGLSGTTAAGSVEGVVEAGASSGGTPPEDQRPEPAKSATSVLARAGTAMKSALSRIAAFANTPEHEASLDQRPTSAR
jgi:lambda family phage portal protein